MPSALVIVVVVELQQPADRDRAAERPGGARRVEAAALVVVLGRPPDPDHHLGAGDHRRDQLAPADAALLRHRQRRHAHGRARMHAGVRPGQVVHLEGMRQRAVGEGRHRRLQARAAAPGSCSDVRYGRSLHVSRQWCAPPQPAGAGTPVPGRARPEPSSLRGRCHAVKPSIAPPISPAPMTRQRTDDHGALVPDQPQLDRVEHRLGAIAEREVERPRGRPRRLMRQQRKPPTRAPASWPRRRPARRSRQLRRRRAGSSG